MGRILAIDYGSKKAGFAVTDESQIVITNLPQIPNDREFWINLQKILNLYRPELILVGYPSTTLGELTPFQKSIHSFKNKLESIFPGPVKLRDESYTSNAAEEIYVQTRGKKKTSMKKIKEKKRKIDSLAAHLLLKSYLNY